MKKYLFLLLLLVPMVCMAQEVAVEEATDVFEGFATFGGTVGIISAIVTQLAKKFDVINKNGILKIVCSVVIGIVICLVAWFLNVVSPMEGYLWYETVGYGALAGLSGCGFYGIVKEIGKIFKKKH